MNSINDCKPGFDFYLHHKGIRILDEPLYFILRSIKEGTLDREFLESGEVPLFHRKLQRLREYLGEPVEPGSPTLTRKMLELMERYEREKKGVGQYLKYGRPPALTVDGVLFEDGKLLLIQRKNDPFKGMHALPGGFVDYGENTGDAVVREMLEETGLETSVRGLLGVYSDPDRDPRGHTVSAIYLMELEGGKLREGDDAMAVEYVDPEDLPPLAFDHDVVVKDALAMIREGH